MVASKQESKQANIHTHIAQCSPTREATNMRKLAGRKTLVVEYTTDNTFSYKCMLPKITGCLHLRLCSFAGCQFVRKSYGHIKLQRSRTYGMTYKIYNVYNCKLKLCQVEEHQHQLAHQCSPNIIGIWEWGISGLMGGAFMAYWVGHL